MFLSVPGILDCFGHEKEASATKPRFNDYVRGPLRQNLVTCLGTEEYISPKMCAVATLPIWLQSLICVLNCDGASCEKSASDGGYTSVYQYAGWWFNGFLFSAPPTMMIPIDQLTKLEGFFQHRSGT